MTFYVVLLKPNVISLGSLYTCETLVKFKSVGDVAANVLFFILVGRLLFTVSRFDVKSSCFSGSEEEQQVPMNDMSIF